MSFARGREGRSEEVLQGGREDQVEDNQGEERLDREVKEERGEERLDREVKVERRDERLDREVKEERGEEGDTETPGSCAD